MKKYTVVFAGTPDLAAKYLESLITDERFKVLCAISQEDKKVGRSQKLTPTPVKKLAKANGVEVRQPLKKAEVTKILKEFKPDFFVVVAYGKILEKESLEVASYTVNVHGSLLPKYRGASPIQSAILNGEKETGISIMKIEEKMDAGAVRTTHNCKITEEDSSVTLFDKFEKMAEFLPEDLVKIANGKLEAKAQDENKVTYCSKIEKEDGKINWSESAKKINNKIRAFTPWPGTFCDWNGKTLKVKSVKVENGKETPGKVFERSGKVFVGTGDGLLEILELQLEGKKSQKIGEFLNGQKDFLGSLLS